jgi:hypothetical protein
MYIKRMPPPKKPAVTLTERFEASALTYIIANWETWDFRPETDKTGTYDTLHCMGGLFKS